MDKKEFNLRFLAQLDRYRPNLLHLATGHEKRPLLRSVLLQACRDDIDMEGFEPARDKWLPFIGLAPHLAARASAGDTKRSPSAPPGQPFPRRAHPQLDCFKKTAWGGKRAGAGAPRSNLNAAKSGAYSKQVLSALTHGSVDDFKRVLDRLTKQPETPGTQR